YSIALPSVHALLDATHMAIDMDAASDLDPSSAADIANSLLADIPLPRISLWLNLTLEDDHITTEINVLEGGVFLANVMKTFGIRDFFLQSPLTIDPSRAPDHALVAHDLLAEQFTAIDQVNTSGPTITSLEHLVGI